MKNCFFVFMSCVILSLTGCMPPRIQTPPLTQLQIRQIETREYDTKDAKLVMKSMMNVLQDEGFILKNVVSDLGLISAEKSVDIEDSGDAFRAQMYHGQYARWAKQKMLEASANVTEFGQKVRIRITFQIRKIDNFGQPMGVNRVTDVRFYQDFFDKVGKGIFIQQENI